MTPSESYPKIDWFLILNPVAGHADAREVRRQVEQVCHESGRVVEIYEITGKEDLSPLACRAAENGAGLVIAAGGDGTVAAVANGLAGRQVPLGILPVGTGNILARALQIPLDLKEALHLLDAAPGCISIDALQVGERKYFLNVSAGISSRSMRSTPRQQKHRFGILAYAWSIIYQGLIRTPRPFQLILDGHEVLIRATEVLVSSGTLLKPPPFPLGLPENLSDSRLTVYILTARTVTDYLHLAWSLLTGRKHKQELRTFTVTEAIRIETPGKPQPVQADGELISQTPVEIRLAPRAIRVIVPDPGAVLSSELKP